MKRYGQVIRVKKNSWRNIRRFTQIPGKKSTIKSGNATFKIIPSITEMVICSAILSIREKILRRI